MVPRLIDPGFKSVADEPRYQPTQWDVLLLSDSAEVAEQIIGQNDKNAGIGVHFDPPSVISRRHSSEAQRTDKFR
jgi:hypothetical protein